MLINPLNIKSIGQKEAFHDYRISFMKTKKEIQKYFDKPLSEITILVLGCGYRYPDVFLFSNVSNRTVGLDVEENFYRDGFLKFQFYNIKMSPLVIKKYRTAGFAIGFLFFKL